MRPELPSSKIYHYGNEDEMEAATQEIRPGDIVCVRMKEGVHRDRKMKQLIARFQQIVNFFAGRGGTKDQVNTVHIAMVVKAEGKTLHIAEAVPNQDYNLRTVDLWNHKTVLLEEEDVMEYDIYRPTDGMLAEKAVEIAKRLCLKSGQVLNSEQGLDLDEDNPTRAEQSKERLSHPFRATYSFLEGAKSILFGRILAGFRSKAPRERFYLSLFDEALEARQTTSDQAKGNEFYCSYFVSHIYQQAEAERMWNTSLEKVDLKQDLNGVRAVFQENERQMAELKEKISNPREQDDVKELNGQLKALQKHQKKIRNVGNDWAKEMAKKERLSLGSEEEKSLFLVNAKFFSPQDFRMHMEKKGFQKVGTLLPPESRARNIEKS